jgi:hypothetical protein
MEREMRKYVETREKSMTTAALRKTATGCPTTKKLTLP